MRGVMKTGIFADLIQKVRFQLFFRERVGLGLAER